MRSAPSRPPSTASRRGKHAKHVRRRKRNVEKEADARLRQARAKERRQEQQVVVVDPDEVVFGRVRGDVIGEALVGRARSRPSGESRPERDRAGSETAAR